jgi:LysR family transcriptional regulator, transcriptional activator of nhaA
MQMFNYRQLFYFRTVATAGGIARAAEQLHLTPQTISGQLAELERALRAKLFTRAGRRLTLTPAGKLALSHAEEIFQIGHELEAALRHPEVGGDQVLRVGIADVVPKSLAYRLLAPSVTMEGRVRLVCQEDKLDRLFAELSVHALDLVIADRPLPAELGVRGFSHLLGRSSLVLQAAPAVATKYRKHFPGSLDGAPMLVPGSGAAIRGAIDRWFGDRGITPHIVGEFDDSALMKAFGQAGAGIFPTPAILDTEVQQQYRVRTLGTADEVVVKYYAITMERRITHPAVAAISQAARQSVFGDSVD